MASTHAALSLASPTPCHDLSSLTSAFPPLRASFSSRLAPTTRQLHVTSRLGLAPAATEPDSFSPFTERASTKRRLGGFKGDGSTSSTQLDPFLRSLDGVPTASLNFPTSHVSAFSPDPSPGIATQTVDFKSGSLMDATWRGVLDSQDRQPVDDDENDISLRLPELKQLLGYLKEARQGHVADDERALGKVFLVGTGPGDAELLTLKAWRLLQSADLVLYDRLVSRDVLDLVHPGARLLYVGKSSGYHSRTQEEIHELLLSFAEAGASVVRLKGGDPLVFGRGGEEVEYLQQHGVEVDIVPGITSASGIGASLGIPLTHRGLANSVRFLTGHSRKGGEDPLHVAASAADPDSTLVIYMGLATLQGLVEKLAACGLPRDTPAVAVERGTTQWQRNVFATMEELPGEVAKAALVSPTLVIIGQVVALSPLWPSQESSNQGTSSLTAKQKRQLVSAMMEPRDRSVRGPDPCLPSERVR